MKETPLITNYARLSQKAKQFLALTGLTRKEYDVLLPMFQNAFLIHMQTYTLEGKKRQKRSYVTYRNCPLKRGVEMLTLPVEYNTLFNQVRPFFSERVWKLALVLIVG